MASTIFDPFLSDQFKDEQLIGNNGIYVDDPLQEATYESETHSDATLERFKTIGNQQAPYTLSGVHITGSDTVSRRCCISVIRTLDLLTRSKEEGLKA